MAEGPQLAGCLGVAVVAAVARGNVGRAHERADAEVFDHALPERECVCIGTTPAPFTRLRGFHGTEQRIGFVDERDVGVGPMRVGDVAGPRTVQQVLFLGREEWRARTRGTTARRRTHERAETEKVVHQLGARQHRPHAFERLDHFFAAPESRRELGVEALGQRVAARDGAPDQRVDSCALLDVEHVVAELWRVALTGREPSALVRTRRRELVCREEDVDRSPNDVTAALVVRALLALRAPHHSRAVLAAEADAQPVEHERDVVLQHALAVADCPRDHASHARRTLDRSHVVRFHTQVAELGLQPRDGAELHVLLAERREHLLDVTEEHRARTDEQHAARREVTAVRVEQVRGTVQRDGGLAGARSAAHDEHAGQVGADRLVLLGLDRGDDVAHAAGAMAIERGEQRALAGDGEARGLRRLGVEHLVVERGDVTATASDEVAAPHHVHRLDGRRPVERFGDRSAPVDDERVVLGVVDREAADVPRGRFRRVRFQVEAPEQQGGLADVELGEAAGGDLVGDVALEPGLVGAAGAHLRVGAAHALGCGAHHLEPGVRSIDVRLFFRDLVAQLGFVRLGQLPPSGAVSGGR